MKPDSCYMTINPTTSRCKPGDACLIVGSLPENRYATVTVTERVGDFWRFTNPSPDFSPSLDGSVDQGCGRDQVAVS